MMPTTSPLTELPPLTHKALKDFLPARFVTSLTYAIFSLVLGFMSAMIYFADLGVFYGSGYLSLLFIISLPLGFLSILLPKTMPSSHPVWTRIILLTGLAGTLLSIVGAVNVISTMFSLVP